jgi:hypothetical protein
MIIDCPKCKSKIILLICAASQCSLSIDPHGKTGTDLLKSLIQDNKIRIINLAKAIRTTAPHLSRMIHKKSPISEKYARNLGEYFNRPWQLFLPEKLELPNDN